MNEKVQKNDYLDMAKRIVTFIKQNKQAPAYVKTVKSQKKASYQLYVFCFSKVLAYYNDNKQLPGKLKNPFDGQDKNEDNKNRIIPGKKKSI